MDAIVAKPYGLETWKRDIDYAEIKTLQQKFFPEFSKLLNMYHNSDHSEKFWWIVVGHWFEIFIRLIFKNVSTIKQCLNGYRISGTTIYCNKNFKLTTDDYRSSTRALYDPEWNDCLNYKIINFLDLKNINIEIMNKNNLSKEYLYFKNSNSNHKDSIKKNILNWAHKGYSFFANKFVSDNDGFIISPYLPLKEEIKLELALGQFPQLWKRVNTNININSNQLLRKNLSKQLIIKTDNDIENLVSKLIFEALPILYLEGFKSLKKIANQQPWPKSPKFIFTASNFNTDDIFKVWTATKVETGTKYYIGQHGNNYCTLRNFFPRVEEKTSDKFFTWGWNNKMSKFKPAFIFKTAGKKKKNHNKNGELLLIQKPLGPTKSTWDIFSEYETYFNDQKEFVGYLSPEIKKKLIIKLYPKFRYKYLKERSRWLEFDPNLTIESNNVNMDSLIKNSRLIVHAYDSTGILENLSQNIPTLAFWQNGFDHLRKKIKPDYQILVNAGIVHLSAKSASKKVCEIWKNVDGWWHQKHVQDARKNFCEKYAKNCDYPARKMASLLQET